MFFRISSVVSCMEVGMLVEFRDKSKAKMLR